MLGLGAAFTGGVVVREQLEKVALPKISRRSDRTGETFKLTVRVVSAVAPALKRPGVFSRSRPKLGVTFGTVSKETELGDWARKGAKVGGVATADEFPWRFGDTLTFTARPEDVVQDSQGLVFRLRAHSDTTVGPLQFQFSGVDDVGEAAVDLRRTVFPACVGSICERGEAKIWESPVILVPLAHVRGGLRAKEVGLGEPVAHVALSFGVDRNPEELLPVEDAPQTPLADIVESTVDRVLGWLDTPNRFFGGDGDNDCRAADEATAAAAEYAGEGAGHSVTTAQAAPPSGSRSAPRPDAVVAVAPDCEQHQYNAPPVAPGLDPEGWICHVGPNERVCWHHTSLGPAPWEILAARGGGVPLRGEVW